MRFTPTHWPHTYHSHIYKYTPVLLVLSCCLRRLICFCLFAICVFFMNLSFEQVYIYIYIRIEEFKFIFKNFKLFLKILNFYKKTTKQKHQTTEKEVNYYQQPSLWKAHTATSPQYFCINKNNQHQRRLAWHNRQTLRNLTDRQIFYQDAACQHDGAHMSKDWWC